MEWRCGKIREGRSGGEGGVASEAAVAAVYKYSQILKKNYFVKKYS